MSKERLFQAIRREEVVLWAGAGFSRYAGYPAGRGFAQILYDSLTKSEQKQVDVERPLPGFAQDYVTLRNYQELFQHLKREFSRKPKSLKTHDQLATIPYIDTIITTNYDNLFELAYGDRLEKIVSDDNLPYMSRDKIKLFKVHGDLQSPKSIVITDKDFRNFFEKRDKLLWTFIESMLATKTMLFVGYGLEDPNVLALFKKTLEVLGPNMRNAYLVAPRFSELRIEALKKEGVIYIDSTGEQLIADMLADMLQHALPDLRKGKSSGDTTGRFLNGLGMDKCIPSSTT